jgi:segregation and condensation protein A
MAPRTTAVERIERIPALGVVAPPPILVSTATFEGSLATLFACVRDHKVDLLEVPLCPICEAYFAYLISRADEDLDSAASAIAALAYLLERKAWLLLPSLEPEPETDDPLELPEPSSQEYRLAIGALREWHEQRSHLFFRSADAGPDPYELPYSMSDISAADLTRAFERLMRRAQPEEPLVPKARISLEEQMRNVLRTMTGEFQTLDQIVLSPFTKTQLVYWFLALLELMRLGQVVARMAGDDVQFALRQHKLKLKLKLEAT